MNGSPKLQRLVTSVIRTTRSGFFQDMALTAVGFVMYGLTKIAYNYVVLREFGDRVLAVNNLAVSAAFLIAILISNLFTISLSRFAPEALGRGEHESFLFVVSFNFWLLFGCAVVGALSFAVFASWIAAQVGTTPQAIRFAAALLVLNTLYTFFKALAYVVRKVRLYTVVEIASAIAFFITLVGCAIAKRPGLLLLPFVVQFGLFGACSVLINYEVLATIKGVREWGRRKEQRIGMMRYSLITGVGTTGSMALSHVITLVLGRIADARAVAFFSSVSAALDPLNLVPRLLSTVTFPRVSRLLGEGRVVELVRFTKKNYRRLTVFTALCCVTALALAPEVVGVLFGREQQSLVPFFRIMLVARFLPMVGVFHISFLSGTHYPTFPNLMGPLALAVSLPLLPLGVGRAGLVGVGLVVLLSSIIRTLPTVAYGESKLAKALTGTLPAGALT